MIHNAITRAGQLLSSIGDLVGLGPEEEGTVRLGESLTPILNVWDLPEAALLRGETLWAGHETIAAVAAEFGFVGIRNPTGSQILAVVEGMELFSTTAAGLGLQYRAVLTMLPAQSATDVDGTATLTQRDERHPSFGTVALTLLNMPVGTAAALTSGGGGTVWATGIPSTETGHLPFPVVLFPGTEIRLFCGTVNHDATVSAWGRFRNFFPSEPKNRG